MTKQPIPLHAVTHLPGGSDPLASGIRFDADNEGGWLYVQTNDSFDLDTLPDPLSVGGTWGFVLEDASGEGMLLGSTQTVLIKSEHADIVLLANGGSGGNVVLDTNTALKLTGLTGATAASRYVGATASGAPASGAFLKGDFVVDQAGAMWVCTTAGSPGTWVEVGGGFTGTVSDVTSGDGSLTVTNPTGPTTDIVIADIEGGTSGTPNVRLRFRRDTAANWTSNNPTLEQGEVGFEYDTLKFKIGDGSTAWNSLAYQGAGSSSPLTTKGDLFGFSTVDARIPVGSDGDVLTADSGQALGLKWAATSGIAFATTNSGSYLDVTTTSSNGASIPIYLHDTDVGGNSGITIQSDNNDVTLQTAGWLIQAAGTVAQMADGNSLTPTMIFLSGPTGTNEIKLALDVGGVFHLYDSGGNLMFQMTDGSPNLHIKTGGVLIADL